MARAHPPEPPQRNPDAGVSGYWARPLLSAGSAGPTVTLGENRYRAMSYQTTTKMKFRSKFAIAAALGLAFTALAANAQLLIVNVRSQATFGPFTGGINNGVTNNGSINTSEVVTTGTSNTAAQFTITYNPLIGPHTLDLSTGTGTLNTGTFNFSSPQTPLNYFSSVALTRSLDFDNNGIWDVTQNYTLNLSPFTAPNGLTGVNYNIIPVQFFGSAVINGQTYSYASVISGATGTLFDGSNNTAAVQFQFIATPVPEASSFALAGVAALGGIVFLRRRFAGRKSAPGAIA